jgi:uncharacterized RDD family membrane protein YckC
LELLYSARTWRRAFAYGVDQLLIGLILSPLYLKQAFEAFTLKDTDFGLRLAATALLAYFFYQVIFLYLFSATPGKALFGLRLENSNHGEKLKFYQICLRSLSQTLLTVLGFSLLVLALFRLDRRHFSDWIAETRVLQSKPRAVAPRRHWVMTFALFAYFANSTIMSLYLLAQTNFFN